MKLSYLYTLVLILSLSSFNIEAKTTGDQDGKTNQKDTSGKKQGKWIYYGKDRPTEGYPADGKVEEGTYVDDRKEGTWIKYYNDGVTPKLKGEYKNNRPEGGYVKINPKGVVIEKGTFVRGKYVDSLKRYHDNGKVEYEGFYNESGNEEGKIKYFYPNGQEEFVYTSENGTPRGKAIRYYENGDIKQIVMYGPNGEVVSSEDHEMKNAPVVVNDPGMTNRPKAPKVSNPITKGAKFLPNGYNKVYNTNQEIWQDGEFRNGQLWDGKVYEYDRDGILLKVQVYKQGVYHSDGQLN